MKKTQMNKGIKTVAVLVTVLILLVVTSVTVFAAEENGAFASLEKGKQIVIIIIKAIGFVVGVIGLAEMVNAFNSHDGASKFKGAAELFGGVIIYFADEILGFIGMS